ncbi:AAA family ATPase [Streptomyces xiaopingdaonensis]|uniref:AAA family ATPase n=1 Tax=Streptomyces xiaopingdaonensis TaxID=1565415 RepID=UPI00036E9C20|nr:P-loop NTPase [Streptomyces xiaopingdaonensis]
MTWRIQPAVSDPEAARVLVEALASTPDGEPLPPAIDSTQLLDVLGQAGAESAADLPEIVLVHELVGPLPALELIREVAVRFPAVGTILAARDTSPALYSSAMDAGARGVVSLPLRVEELNARIGAAGGWAAGVRRHLGAGGAGPAGAGGTVVAVTGAKGGVGATLAAVQLALAAHASGRSTALVDLDLQSGDVASYLDVQYRRSVADLAGIQDVSPRVLQDAVYAHESGVALLLAPGEGERGEEVDDRAVRQIVGALRSRYEVVVVDCGAQLTAGSAAAVELADRAVLFTTPDVVSVRAAKRAVRLWDRLQVRKAEEIVTVVNRASRQTEIQPPLVARITGTPVARTAVPSHFKDLQTAVDAGRLQDLDDRSVVKQALWALAGELGVAAAPEQPRKARGKAKRREKHRGDKPQPPEQAQALPGAGSARQALPPGTAPPRQAPDGGRPGRLGGERGAASVEFAGMAPIVLVVLALVWQAVLIGYTFSLAGNAADEGARAAASAEAYGDPQGACQAAATEHLPAKWRGGSKVACSLSGDVWKADVDMKTPILFPGSALLPFTVAGEAGAAKEG